MSKKGNGTAAVLEQPVAQLVLVPEERPEGEPRTVSLADLPMELVGPVPDSRFVESVQRFGVLEPIILHLNRANGQYTVIDGRRRIMAARTAGLVDIEAHVYEFDGPLSDTATLLLQAQRKANPAAELQAIERLLSQGASPREIVRATGMMPATIQRRLKLKALIPGLRQAFEAGLLSASVAEEAAALPEGSQAVLAEKLDRDGRLTGKDVHDLRRVQVEAAMAALPDDAFAPPEMVAEPSQCSINMSAVEELVQAAQELIDMALKVEKSRTYQVGWLEMERLMRAVGRVRT